MLRPYPAKTVLAWTPDDYLSAVNQADAGNVANLCRFADALLKDDRIGGVCEQRTLGMFALPSVIDAAFCEAPERVPEWPSCFPEAEQALWLTRALVCGFAFARRECVLINGVLRTTYRVWDGQWFSWRDDEKCWYVQARGGDNRGVYRKVTREDGWVILTPFGRHEPWRFGLVHRLAVPYLAKTYAIDDRSRDGEVTSMLVAETEGLGEAQRQRFITKLDELAERGSTKVVLPKGCTLKALIRSDSTTAGIHDRIIAWADQSITITIAGQLVTTEGSEGFSSGSVQKSILSSILRAQEEAYSTAVGEQIVTPLARSYGWKGATIYQRWQIQDATDLNAQSFAIGQLAGSVDQLNKVLSRDGLRIDLASLVTRTGLPLLALPPTTDASPTEKIPFAPTDIATSVTRNELRGVYGLPPLALPNGQPDPRGYEFVTPVTSQPPANDQAMALKAHAFTADLRTFARSSTPLNEPATRFTLFTWGENESTKGTVFLDRESAEATVREFGSRDVMIDLEHLSLDPESNAYDPDARGYGKLVIDPDVGLVIDAVRWTDDGTARIVGRRQRYTSPAFLTDKDGRVVRLHNVALCANPAMRYIEPLIAAKKTLANSSPKKWNGTMNPEQLAQIAEILGLGADAPVGDIISALQSAVPGGMPPADSGEMAKDPPADSPPPEEEKKPEETMSAFSKQADAYLKRMSKAVEDVEALTKRAKDNADREERESVLRTHSAKFNGPMRKWAETAPLEAIRAYAASAPDMQSEPIDPPKPEMITLSRVHSELAKKFNTPVEYLKKVIARDLANGRAVE